MKRYTIVGQYWDNQQTWIETITAPSAGEAMNLVPDGIEPLAVFEGDLTPIYSYNITDYV